MLRVGGRTSVSRDGNQVGRFRGTKKTGRRGLALALGAALTLGMAVAAPQAAIAAENTAVLEITKSASAETAKPGEIIEYRIEIGCSTITDLGCRGATLSDLIPAEFEIIPGSVVVSNATSNPPVVDGNQVTVEFTDPLGDGTVGLAENADAVIVIQVKLRDNLPFEANGVPVVNTAVANAENAEEVFDEAVVTPNVELALNTEVTKAYDPDISQAAPGTTTQLTVNGVNTSNAGVDSLSFTDPTNPDATPNPFDLLAVKGVDTLTFPEGAKDTATVEYYVDGNWVAFELKLSDMPHAPPAPADPKGVRVTFHAEDGKKILSGASGGFELKLEQRESVADLEETTTVNNTVTSEVTLGEESANAENSADYTLVTEPISVGATKKFDPKELIEGQETTVTLGGTNTSLTDLESLSIREPASGDFAPELDFTGFTGNVQFPEAATGGTLTLEYLDDQGQPQTFGPVALDNGQPYPTLPQGITLKNFVIDFEGPITPGGSTEIQFTAEANELAFDENGNNMAPVDNVVGVEGMKDGESANAEADDTITFEEKKIEIVTKKQLSPEEIWGFEGEGVLVQLPTTVVKPGSNVPATEIIVSDPELSDPANPDSAPKDSAFWDNFTPQAITNTSVPDGAKLTVRFWNTETNAWEVIDGFDGLTGVVNMDLPADILDKIGGIQFVFENPDPGFEPHALEDFNVNPSFTATLNENREPGSDPITLANCASSSGAVDDGTGIIIAEDETDAPACDDITIKAPKPGEYDLFWKSWEGAGNPAQIVQRSGDHAVTRLHWSTENLTFDKMTLGETRLGTTPGAGPSDDVAQTTFEAFNLVKIKAVTEDKGFVAGWDMITAIDLWIGGSWVPATNATGLPYTKTMSDIALTAAEQRDATAVRITFEENPGGRLSAGAPPVGSGLTKSTGRDRKVDLEWELRDVRRSDPEKAVIASEIFNVEGQEGLVKNWGSATGEQPGGGVEHDQDDDDITIVPRPLGVTVTKGWSGGPLGVPAADIPAEAYPTSRVKITSKNTSPQKVDKLTIVEPGAGKASPFEIFTLVKVVAAPHPVTGGNPDKTLMVLTKSDGSIIDPAGIGGVTPGQAIAMTADALKDVVKVELRHEGRIATGAEATLQLDLQLRKTHRSDPNKRVTVADSPIKNEATAIVTDLAGLEQEHSVDKSDDAQIQLDTFTLAVATTKNFTPDQQRVEWTPGDPKHTSEEWPSIRMDLTARPMGTARADKLVVTDSGENRADGAESAKSFWNAFRFQGFIDDTLTVAAPINRVQAEVLFGDFVETGSQNRLDFVPLETIPGDKGWVAGSADPVPVTGGKIENASATLLADVADQDYDKVRGIRLTFERVDGSGSVLAFENPANPEVKIALDVKRRAYFVSDPSVPVSDSNVQIAAPGERPQENGGVFTNTVDAETESYMKFPDGDGNTWPLVANDEATDRVTYLAAGIQVAVEKTPIGAQQPGSVIPFKLKTTNTSPRADNSTPEGKEENEVLGIGDPVIIDMFPVEDGKPQLIFDPDMDPAKRFSFALDNRMAPNSSVMPVKANQVDVTYLDELGDPLVGDGEPFGVKFTFAKGRVLYPQEAYTVTVNMMFRPGVEAGQANALTNKFKIVSENERFTGCNFVEFPSGHEVDECEASTEVYPTEAGALRGKKYVRANDTELETNNVPNPNPSKDVCVTQFEGPQVPGYYVNNCVPITKPLGVETWREELQNTGTISMDKVITIDSLPKIDDQGALVLLPRKSEWQPSWVGNTKLVTAVDVDGNDYRADVTQKQYYSSSEGAACVADLKPTEQQCVDFWTLMPADASEADLAALNIRHVKTEFEFPADTPLAPGERLAYSFQTRTPAQAPKMTADTVAWNSVAVGARTVTTDGKGAASVLPTEGLRVGVALATGPLSVQKTVTGPGAEFAPETFDVQVVCTVPEREGSIGGSVTLDPVTVTVEAGDPVVLDEQFPWGAKCTVEDVPGANGETSSTVGDPVEIGRDTDPVPVAKLTNTYELASFTVDKEVTGASNQDGDPIDYGSFLVAASCTFMGNNIALDPAETELTADGTKWLVDQLPVGAECTLTELDAKGARANLTIGNQFVEPNEDGSWTFTLTADQPDIELVLTNVFPRGAISIEKQITGEGAAAISDDTKFTFSVLCTYEGNTVWDGTVEFTKAEIVAGNGLKLIDTLPYGGSCTVEETGTGGATSTSITPDTSEAPVEVGPNEFPVVFTAVNTYDAGNLHVTKEIAGAGAELYGAGPFEVSLACTVAGTPANVPDGATRPLTAENGYEAEYTGLPLGAECELTETLTGGATSSEIVDAAGDPVTEPVVIGDGEDLALRVINTFDIGGIEVEKKIEGPGAQLGADKVFTVALACTIDRDGTATTVEIPDGAERELSKKGGLTASYEQLPVGAVCELRETKTGGAETVTITPNAGDAKVGTVTVADGAAAKLSVVNEFAAPPVPPVPPVDPGTPVKPGGGLPTTGGSSMLWWGIGGAGLLLLGAGALLVRARRREHAE